jgi:TRAP-type transport system periplasmic protein
MQRRQLLKTGAGGLIAGAPLVLRAQGRYKDEYKMSTVLGTAFAWGKAGETFANLVRERTQGRINIKQYPGSSLVQGQQDREFAAMRQGVIDVLCGSVINWSTTVRECAIFSLPFLMPDHKAFDAVIRSEAVTRDWFDIIRRAGAEPLAIGEAGYRQISNSKRPIIKPEDFKGLKVRILASPLYQEVMTGLGANPTAMSWADAQPALASGAVDGQENPLELFLAAKIHTLGQRFVTKWNYSNDILLFAIAHPIWQTWSAQDQAIVREAAQDAARQNLRDVRALFAQDVERVRALGVEVHVPTSEQMSLWRIAARRSYARWKGMIAPQLITRIEEIVEASRKA